VNFFFCWFISLRGAGIGLTILFLLIGSVCSAQNNDSTDYFPPPPGNSSAVSSVLRSQKHLVLFDVTQNTWLNLPEGVTTKFISGGFNFGLYYDFFIAKKFFGIAPGISFSNATVKNNSYPITTDVGDLKYNSLLPYPDSVSYLTNKFSISYFDIPVELRFRIHPDERGKNFWFAPGFRAGILLSDFWKHKYETAGMVFKTKIYNQPNIEKFHYGITLRAGYYKFGVYAFYSLSSFFERGRGPDIVPLSVGLTLTPL
jgi:hypothetical protein